MIEGDVVGILGDCEELDSGFRGPRPERQLALGRR